MPDVQNILHFWFDETEPKRWFQSSDDFDKTVRDRFESFSQAQIHLWRQQTYHAWQEHPHSALALILIADQFPRNMYRASVNAFAWDDLALGLARLMTTKGMDKSLNSAQRQFIYMPFMHSENLADQQLCVDLCRTRLNDANNLHHAREHYRLIQRFGRFPHRNHLLGRPSTEDEITFLESGGYQP